MGINIITDSAEKTISFGRRIAPLLKNNCVIALSGNLGSGKTTLVKGIAQGLGIDPWQVNSPSFVLIREYRGKENSLFHCDLYRLEAGKQIVFLGLEDYFSQEGVLVIEWAKKAGKLLPVEYLNIDIDFLSKHKRRFKISAKGKSYSAVVKKIEEKIKKRKSKLKIN